MKPVIGIMAHIIPDKGPLGHSHTGNTYVASISRCGGIPVIIPAILTEEERKGILSICDGFLFTGGIDVTPCMYDDEPHLKLAETNLSLDNTQIPLMQDIIREGKPVLGICRGHQVLNVACGGTLYQDISEIPNAYIKHFHKGGFGEYSHSVKITAGSRLEQLLGGIVMVNSHHHQALKELGKGLEPVAYSTDGVIEAVEHQDHPFCIGVQWHPEAMFAGAGNESMRPIFEALVQASDTKKK